ncbi:hypothetical protein [Streptomyces narbonensis]
MTARVLDHVRGLGLATPNTDGLPIVEIPLSDAEDLDAVATFLWEHGIYVTLASYPLVPRDRVGFRIQITAANADKEFRSRTRGRSWGTITHPRPRRDRHDRRGRQRSPPHHAVCAAGRHGVVRARGEHEPGGAGTRRRPGRSRSAGRPT